MYCVISFHKWRPLGPSSTGSRVAAAGATTALHPAWHGSRRASRHSPLQSAAATPPTAGFGSSDDFVGAQAVASTTTQPEQQQERRARRRSGSGLRREDLPFFIARSDLTWEQPWRFEQSAAISELRLRQQGVNGLDDAAAASSGRHATARFKVELPLGLGALVVTGEVAADVPLRCEMCDAAFERRLAGVPFDAVVLLEAGTAGAQLEDRDLAANELVFNTDTENLCDITPLVTDAIVASIPSVCLCGGGSCRQHAGQQVAWRSSPAAPSAASSPFAKLLAQQGTQQEAKKKRK